MATARLRFRDAIRAYVPKWLADRGQSVRTATVGFRVLWTMVAALDCAEDVLVQGLKAAWPGVGTPTALQWIGQSRGIIRGQGESDSDYAARLVPWLDRWRRAGSQDAIAVALHEYLTGRPRVRVVNRHGHMVTCELDGTLTRANVAWDWDGVTNPENATHWWDQWIIIYPTPWAVDGVWDGVEVWGGPLGFGHDVPREDFDAVLGLVRQWKSAHSFVRAIVWSYNGTLFDPATPSSLPAGDWGRWHVVSGGVAVPSGRRSDCRFWDDGIT